MSQLLNLQIETILSLLKSLHFRKKKQKCVFLVGNAPTFSCAQTHVLQKPVLLSFVNPEVVIHRCYSKKLF